MDLREGQPMRDKTPSKSLPSGLEELIEAVRRRRAILFVGGGVSQNLGLPDFQALIQHIAQQLGFPADALPVSEYSVMAEAFLLKNGSLKNLRDWMDATWHPANIDICQSRLHNLIVDLDFPILYTTNYDHWLEIAFEKRGRPFHKITSVADLATAPKECTEIIKFHGDLSDVDSLVLTESSYFQRMDFESPLDIRLRADSLARPILFLGYSLQDVNTRYLLYRLEELWKSSKQVDQRPLSYIVMTEQDQRAQEIVLESRGIRPIRLNSQNPGEATTQLMGQLYQAVRRA